MNLQKTTAEQAKRVGSNYSERRQLSSNQPSFSESAKTSIARDNFGAKAATATENFSSNANYSSSKVKTPVLTRLENGRLPRAAAESASPRVTDDMRLAFLDKIISTGKPAIKTAVKSTTRQIKA